MSSRSFAQDGTILRLSDAAQRISDINDQHFARAIPSKGQRVLNASADEQSASILIVETESIPGIEESAWIEFSLALIENKLAAVEMSAEGEGKRASRCGRMMSAEQVMICRLEGLAARAVKGAVGREKAGSVFQPPAAAIDHGVANALHADPTVVVSGDGADGSDTR